MNLKKETSCGCIIIKDNRVLLVYEKDGSFWGFPKGHMKEGENELETVQREVKEEVGLDVEIDTNQKYILNYVIKNKIDKTIILYRGIPKNNTIKMQEDEIEDIKWCDFDEAINILTFDNLKELFKKVIKDMQ